MGICGLALMAGIISRTVLLVIAPLVLLSLVVFIVSFVGVSGFFPQHALGFLESDIAKPYSETALEIIFKIVNHWIEGGWVKTVVRVNLATADADALDVDENLMSS